MRRFLGKEGVLIYICVVLFGLSAFAPTSAFAQSKRPLTTTLHFAYLKAGYKEIRFVGCEKGQDECRHDLDRGAYVLARGDGAGTPIVEVSAYFNTDKPAAWQATQFLQASMAVFSSISTDSQRAFALKQIVSQAASTRRGEAALSGINYVLRASDGNNIRVYVTLQ